MLGPYVQFLRDRERDDDAERLEERLAELLPAAEKSSARIAWSPVSYWATTVRRCRANIRFPVASALVAWLGDFNPNCATNVS